MIPRRQLFTWMMFSFGLWFIFSSIGQQTAVPGYQQIDYSQFLTELEAQQISRVEIEEKIVRGERADGSLFQTIDPGDSGSDRRSGRKECRDICPAAGQTQLSGATVDYAAANHAADWLHLLDHEASHPEWRRGRCHGIRQEPGARIQRGRYQSHLKDVAGVDEAKEEVAELVDFLRDPDRFRAVGGNIPRGVLMVGTAGHGQDAVGESDCR